MKALPRCGVAWRRTQTCWSAAYVRQWSRTYRQMIVRRQWICRAAAQVLRRPRLVRLLLPALACFPWLALPMVRYLKFDGGI